MAQLIADAGFEPVDLGGIDDSQFREPGSALWNSTLEPEVAGAGAGDLPRRFRFLGAAGVGRLLTSAARDL